MVCDDIRLVDSLFSDLPDVVVDEQRMGVGICGSSKWGILGELSSLFISILSHESIHLTLLEKLDGKTSDCLDEVASFSTISRRVENIPLVRRYSHGMIGLDLDHVNQRRKEKKKANRSGESKFRTYSSRGGSLAVISP
jgi:hypothetical protein